MINILSISCVCCFADRIVLCGGFNVRIDKTFIFYTKFTGVDQVYKCNCMKTMLTTHIELLKMII